MFVLTELEGPGGGPPRTIAFANAQVQPLDFASLRDARLDRPITIPLNWRNGTLVETTVEGTEPGQVVNAAATLESPFTSCAIGLVKGGWLPSAFAVTQQNTTMLIDRNIVTQIVGRFKDGQRRYEQRDFLDLFADQPIRINPLLFVMEGNRRSAPTPAEAEGQMQEVAAKLRAALPKAEITVSPEHLKGALGLIEDSRVSLMSKHHLLRHLAPLLASPVARATSKPDGMTLSLPPIFMVCPANLLSYLPLSAPLRCRMAKARPSACSNSGTDTPKPMPITPLRTFGRSNCSSRCSAISPMKPSSFAPLTRIWRCSGPGFRRRTLPASGQASLMT